MTPDDTPAPRTPAEQARLHLALTELCEVVLRVIQVRCLSVDSGGSADRVARLAQLQAERDRLEGERLRERMRERRAGLAAAAAGGARGPSRSRG